MNLIEHLIRQKKFSEEVFGPMIGPQNTEGLLDHIEKELEEIREDPTDLEEWIDVVILALDGALRAGWSPWLIAECLEYKQEKNENRKWPDWRTCEPGKAIEHIKEDDHE